MNERDNGETENKNDIKLTPKTPLLNETGVQQNTGYQEITAGEKVYDAISKEMEALRESLTKCTTQQEIIKQLRSLRAVIDDYSVQAVKRHRQESTMAMLYNKANEGKDAGKADDSAMVVSEKNYFDMLKDQFSHLSQGFLLINLLVIYLTIGLLYFTQQANFSFLNSLYTIVIIFTTVGYGLDYAESDGDQVFLIFYAIVGVAVVFSSVSVGFEKSLDGIKKKRATKFIHGDEISSDDETYHWTDAVTKSNITPWAVWFSFLLLGALFIGYLEDWSYVESVYFCVITGSTIGFGDYAPTTAAGKWVLIFYIPGFLLITAYVFSIMFKSALGAFIDDTLEQEQELESKMDSLLSQDNYQRNLTKMDVDGDGKIDEAEYVIQVLVNHYDVSRQFLDKIRGKFRLLDTNGDGEIDFKDFNSNVV